MDIGVSNRVVARSSFGRFIAAADRNASATVRDAIEDGANISRALAPVGTKHDYRTIPLKDSIETEMLSSTSGRWVARARHALPVERGAGPHLITKQVKFFWENMGRWWVPGEGFINHPGNRAQPYLRPAYEIVTRRLMDIARRHYP